MQYFFGDGLRLGCGYLGNLAQLFQHHHELISTEPRNRVGLTNASGEAASHFLKQQVAGFMAKRVVQRLEVVEVGEQKCPQTAAPGAGG
jgi:hypothetical protein